MVSVLMPGLPGFSSSKSILSGYKQQQKKENMKFSDMMQQFQLLNRLSPHSWGGACGWMALPPGSFPPLRSWETHVHPKHFRSLSSSPVGVWDWMWSFSLVAWHWGENLQTKKVIFLLFQPTFCPNIYIYILGNSTNYFCIFLIIENTS